MLTTLLMSKSEMILTLKLSFDIVYFIYLYGFRVFDISFDICRAEKHGKEVVALVSDILNKCGAAKDSAASALALEALIPLCRHDVVDVYSIWRSLSPR